MRKLSATSFALVFLTVALATAPGRALAAPPVVKVGIASQGQNAIEFVGRVDQDGSAFTGYGYLTRISGLSDNLLYTDQATRNETTARFTFHVATTLTSHNVLGNITALDSEGTIIFYFNATPSGDFVNPASFAAGAPIVTGTIRYQSILNVQAPNKGIATGTGEFSQLAAAVFSIGEQSYQLGQAGLSERLSTTGDGTRTDAVVPRSFIILAGNGVVAGTWGEYTWEGDFEAQHGRKPTDQDKADLAWSLTFASQTGHSPTIADWIAHWQQGQK